MTQSVRKTFDLSRKGLACLMSVALTLGPVTQASASRAKVGVASAVIPQAKLGESLQELEVISVGDRVDQDVLIETGKRGRTQVLFIDGSSMNIGPSSRIVIDEFVFDPSQLSGNLGARIEKGSMRFIGGLLSKRENQVKFGAGEATVGIRGGIAKIALDGSGKLKAELVHGRLSVTTPEGIFETDRVGTLIERDVEGDVVTRSVSVEEAKEELDKEAKENLIEEDAAEATIAPDSEDEKVEATEGNLQAADQSEAGEEVQDGEANTTSEAAEEDQLAGDEDGGSPELEASGDPAQNDEPEAAADAETVAVNDNAVSSDQEATAANETGDLFVDSPVESGLLEVGEDGKLAASEELEKIDPEAAKLVNEGGIALDDEGNIVPTEKMLELDPVAREMFDDGMLEINEEGLLVPTENLEEASLYDGVSFEEVEAKQVSSATLRELGFDEVETLESEDIYKSNLSATRAVLEQDETAAKLYEVGQLEIDENGFLKPSESFNPLIAARTEASIGNQQNTFIEDNASDKLLLDSGVFDTKITTRVVGADIASNLYSEDISQVVSADIVREDALDSITKLAAANGLLLPEDVEEKKIEDLVSLGGVLATRDALKSRVGAGSSSFNEPVAELDVGSDGKVLIRTIDSIGNIEEVDAEAALVDLATGDIDIGLASKLVSDEELIALLPVFQERLKEEEEASKGGTDGSEQDPSLSNLSEESLIPDVPDGGGLDVGEDGKVQIVQPDTISPSDIEERLKAAGLDPSLGGFDGSDGGTADIGEDGKIDLPDPATPARSDLEDRLIAIGVDPSLGGFDGSDGGTADIGADEKVDLPDPATSARSDLEDRLIAIGVDPSLGGFDGSDSGTADIGEDGKIDVPDPATSARSALEDRLIAIGIDPSLGGFDGSDGGTADIGEDGKIDLPDPAIPAQPDLEDRLIAIDVDPSLEDFNKSDTGAADIGASDIGDDGKIATAPSLDAVEPLFPKADTVAPGSNLDASAKLDDLNPIDTDINKAPIDIGGFDSETEFSPKLDDLNPVDIVDAGKDSFISGLGDEFVKKTASVGISPISDLVNRDEFENEEPIEIAKDKNSIVSEAEKDELINKQVEDEKDSAATDLAEQQARTIRDHYRLSFAGQRLADASIWGSRTAVYWMAYSSAGQYDETSPVETRANELRLYGNGEAGVSLSASVLDEETRLENRISMPVTNIGESARLLAENSYSFKGVLDSVIGSRTGANEVVQHIETNSVEELQSKTDIEICECDLVSTGIWEVEEFADASLSNMTYSHKGHWAIGQPLSADTIRSLSTMMATFEGHAYGTVVVDGQMAEGFGRVAVSLDFANPEDQGRNNWALNDFTADNLSEPLRAAVPLQHGRDAVGAFNGRYIGVEEGISVDGGLHGNLDNLQTAGTFTLNSFERGNMAISGSYAATGQAIASPEPGTLPGETDPVTVSR